MSHFDIEYWEGLGSYRMIATKDSMEGEKEACVPSEFVITYDGGPGENTPRTHEEFYGTLFTRPPSNIKMGGEALARKRRENGESNGGQVTRPSTDNTVGDGFVGPVTMLKMLPTVMCKQMVEIYFPQCWG